MINTENKNTTEAYLDYPELRALDFNATKVELQTTGTPYIHAFNHDRSRQTSVDSSVGMAVIRSYRNSILPFCKYENAYEAPRVIGIVGDRYQIIHNRDLYTSLIEASERAFSGQDTGATLVEEEAREGAWSKATLSFPSIGRDIRQLTGKKTHLRLSAGFSNTYDGSGKVRAFVGATDLWCMNGCSVMESSKIARKHTSGFDLRNLTDFLTEGFEIFNKKVAVWQSWADRRVTPAEAKKLLEDLGLEGRRAKGIMEQIEKEFSQRGESLWSVYSALTYEASHDSEQFPTRKTKGASTTALTLDRRAQNVERLVNSPAFLQLAA